MAVATYTVLACLLSWGLAFLFGQTLLGATGRLNGAVFVTLLCQLLVMLATAAMYHLVAMALKKMGAAIAANIIVPLLVTLLLNMLNTWLNLQDWSLNDYWLTNLTATNEILSGAALTTPLVMAVIYLVAFTVLGVVVNRRQEK